MKKVQPKSPLPRSRPGTAPSSSSRSNVGDDLSLSMRSLNDNLPDHTPRRTLPPSKVASRRASFDQQVLSKPSTKKSSIPRVSVSNHSTVSSLGKQINKKEGDVTRSRVRKVSNMNPTADEVKKSGVHGKGVQSMAANLPMDSLYLCFEKLQSVYHIVTCAAVCRYWREAALSDVVWKAFYLRWWHQEEDKGASSRSPQTSVKLPPGFDTWRDAFISKYSAGKRKIQSEVITHGVNAGWLRIRRMQDRRGKQVRDCMPGDAMRKLIEQLGLTFHICINRDPPIRLRGKASVVYFPGSCLLKYPTKTTKGGLSLISLKSFKVTATSDRLLRTCTVASFMGGHWEMVSREGQNPGPLRLLQQTPKHSTSLIVGTLFEGVHGTDEFSIEEHGEEQVLLLMVSLHLSDIIWIMLELGQGATPQFSRRIYNDHMDPSFGLYGWHASIQIHTFGKLLWSQEFRQVFWSPRESIAGQTAVFLLISSHEVFPGMLSSPWRTEVFSGELRGVFMLDFTLWDAGMEIAWHCTRAVKAYPAELATVEYGPPGLDGERVHTGVQDDNQGVSVSMNLCTPFEDEWSAATQDQDRSVAITDLRFALTPKFLISWFGRSNIYV